MHLFFFYLFCDKHNVQELYIRYQCLLLCEWRPSSFMTKKMQEAADKFVSPSSVMKKIDLFLCHSVCLLFYINDAIFMVSRVLKGII